MFSVIIYTISIKIPEIDLPSFLTEIIFFIPQNICQNYRNITPTIPRHYGDITPELWICYGNVMVILW